MRRIEDDRYARLDSGGRLTMKVAPSPARLSHWIWPPISSTSFFTILSPSPVDGSVWGTVGVFAGEAADSVASLSGFAGTTVLP